MMKMEILRCKTPEMLRKEIYVHLLVYNLIRALMAKAAEAEGHKPREVSFKTAQDTLRSYHHLLLMGTINIFQILGTLIHLIGKHKVGNRPGRSEPRAVKRRSKPSKKLQHSRKQARKLKEYKDLGLKSVQWDEAGDQWLSCAIAQGFNRQSSIHCVSDGAKWIVSQAKESLGIKEAFLSTIITSLNTLQGPQKSVWAKRYVKYGDISSRIA